MFKTKRVCLTIEEFNEKLNYYKERRAFVKEAEELGTTYAIYDIRTVNASFILRDYNENNKLTTYEFVTKLDGSLSIDRITGMDAFVQLRKMSDFEVLEDEVQMDSARPILWKNEKFENKWVQAISYDVNSAYAYAMIQDMPDTANPLGPGIVEEGQIGFEMFDAMMKQPGEMAYYRFNLIESPFKHFVEYYYSKKKTTTDKKEKQKAKDMLNFSVGYLQRKNPFLRARIIELCNERIRSLIDENTIYCNTDSIVSLVERPDLELGDELGNFKVEHKGDFAYKGFNYQWKNETVAVRGVSKQWFDDDFDLLTDELPSKECNKYKFNYAKFIIEEA